MKPKTFYICQSCGGKEPRWMGRCPNCNEWNTLTEEIETGPPSGRLIFKNEKKENPVRLSNIERVNDKRQRTGIAEFDRILGGGIVPGSLVLIGGDPGIGKSTILLQISRSLCDINELPVLYITGEESITQVRMRGERIGGTHGPLYILAETSLEDIIPHIDKLNPSLVVIDSIQTLYTTQLQSAPGSISQVREVAARLLNVSKKSGVPIFLIGHVTKEGMIAGPRVLEHMVDTVLYFEGDKGNSYRILRAVKNRFGPVNEIGVFEMKSEGLREVPNPSELFLSERPSGVSGSVVTASIEGTRPLLVEIQALTSATKLGMARRSVIGTDSNRVSLLVAVLEKRIGIYLQAMDIFINLAGGVTINEPSADLAIIAAIASSMRDLPVDPLTIMLGEVGLSGEVRGIPMVDSRLTEASKLGFTRCVLPKKKKGYYKKSDMELIEVSSASECMQFLFNKQKQT